MPRDQDEPGVAAAAVTPGAHADTPAPQRRASAGQPGTPGTRTRTRTRTRTGSGSAGRTDPAAWLIASATFAAYAAISASRYLRLDPGTWDLGIYTEYVAPAGAGRAHQGSELQPAR